MRGPELNAFSPNLQWPFRIIMLISAPPARRESSRQLVETAYMRREKEPALGQVAARATHPGRRVWDRLDGSAKVCTEPDHVDRIHKAFLPRSPSPL
ncbi:hypothetical protein MKZ38_004019 [Zalerion maritima]|uniref:Uncharacterized protein n=1 Tax=Zalerion maritima TaxID=339359 RepID=A0AAD5RNE5_9PEZI|nr:hypothetical protein MKZ38_004019 [Zalerion maritima]